MKHRPSSLALASANASVTPRESASLDALLAATAQIVGAYLVNRPEEQVNLTGLTSDVFATLKGLSEQEAAAASLPPAGSQRRRKPAVSVEESVRPDYLVCLEDGKRVKMLKRYLRSAYNMTPEQYRARWDLPANYPMVAPNYAIVRSKLAKKIGLGKRPLDKRGMPSVAKRMGRRNEAQVVGLR